MQLLKMILQKNLLWKFTRGRVMLAAGMMVCQAMAAQSPVLTPEDAISIALKNSFGIQVARNNAEISRINNSIGNAGMLPNINVNGNANYSESNVTLGLSNNDTIQSTNGQTTQRGANVALSWVLFDGGRMFITKNRLGELEQLGQLRLKDTLQQTIYSVIAAYYNIVSQKQQLKSINEAINFGKEQVNILQVSFNAGLTARNNVLQAKIDLNVLLENSLNQAYLITAQKRALNQMLMRDPATDYEVIDSIPPSMVPSMEELINQLYTNNISVQSAQKQANIARLTIREYNATRYPRINLTAGYNLSLVDNTASNILFNHNYGPQVGATLTMPIFQGGAINRQVSISKVQYLTSQINLENVKLRVSTQLQNALTQFENQLALLNIEVENEGLARENVQIAIERLRLGQSNSLEVRQAEESYVFSYTRRITFEYNLKLAETRVKQLVAGL